MVAMTYLGKVQGGVIVFDGDQKPAEGSLVRVDTVDEKLDDSSLSKALMKLAGTLDGPEDGSVNVDHYLYGLPKK
jgi:hypothetical protein